MNPNDFTPLTQDSEDVEIDENQFTPGIEPQATWCPGCGDFAVLNALKKAMANIGKTPDEALLVTGIGCSGKLSSYFDSYGFHSLHGRALPIGRGSKLANTDLEVIVAGGDGDGYGIGGNHFLHTARENHDMTYIVFNNEIFGLTKGQTSPTSPKGHKSKTQIKGSAKDPMRPLSMAMAGGASYIARTSAVNPNQAAEILTEAIEHNGFAHIDFLTQCPTWNKDARGYLPYTDIQDSDEFDFDLNNREEAIQVITQVENSLYEGEILTGRLYVEEGRKTYHEEKQERGAIPREPIVYQNFDQDYEFEGSDKYLDRHR